MKVRNGFVSNSSSSSFIVTGKSPKITVQLDVDLSKYGKVINDKKDLEKEFKDWYGSDFREEFSVEKDFNKCLSAINAGKVVVMGDFDSQSEDEIEAFLCNN